MESNSLRKDLRWRFFACGSDGQEGGSDGQEGRLGVTGGKICVGDSLPAAQNDKRGGSE